jgi:hypothetical protein
MLSLLAVLCPIRDAVQARADHLSDSVNTATAIVGLGVGLELIEPIHDFVTWVNLKRRELAHRKQLAEVLPVSKTAVKAKHRSLEHPKWVKWFGRIGLILVVIGVVGEWRCGAKLEDAHNTLHTFDMALLTGTQLEASEANERAGKLEKDAAQLRKDATAEGLKVEGLRKANNEAASKLEEEVGKRMALAVSLLDRDFWNQSGAIGKLSAFHPVSVKFEFSDEHEVIRTVRQLSFVTGQLGWKSSRRRGFESSIRDGVTVSHSHTFGAMQQEQILDSLCNKLKESLQDSGIDAVVGFSIGRLPAGTVLISVGAKPNHAVEEAIKELAEPHPISPLNGNVMGGNLGAIPADDTEPPQKQP